MAQTHSGAADEGGASERAALLRAALPMFKRGDMAIALLDASLRIRSILGGEKFSAEPGDLATEAFPALIGCEEILQEMRAGRGEWLLSFENVSIHSRGDGAAPQYVNLCVYRGESPEADLTLTLQDASPSAAMQRSLVQQRNELAIARQALEVARDAALAASRAKSAFLANVSHELRTPLNVVIGNAEILRRPRAVRLSADETADYVQDILSSGELLLDLINDLIDLSRAETGDLRLSESWCDIPYIAQQSLRYAARLEDGRDKNLLEAIEPSMPPFWGDERRIKQILLNLLSNAVKFSPVGSAVRLTARRADNGDLELEIEDEGAGLSPDELAIAMEPFGQLETAQRHKGTGLGLPIVKSLAELHGGELRIDTATGKGLRARVAMPAARFQERRTP